MGKINKNSNLYDKDGNLLRHVNEDGLLKDMKIKEVQDLVDELGTQKDERGNLIKPREFNNASSILMQMYNDPKNIKERNELVSQLINKSKINKEEVTKSLKETEEELVKPTPSYDVNTNNDEYIEPIPA